MDTRPLFEHFGDFFQEMKLHDTVKNVLFESKLCDASSIYVKAILWLDESRAA